MYALITVLLQHKKTDHTKWSSCDEDKTGLLRQSSILRGKIECNLLLGHSWGNRRSTSRGESLLSGTHIASYSGTRGRRLLMRRGKSRIRMGQPRRQKMRQRRGDPRGTPDGASYRRYRTRTRWSKPQRSSSHSLRHTTSHLKWGQTWTTNLRFIIGRL